MASTGGSWLTARPLQWHTLMPCVRSMHARLILTRPQYAECGGAGVAARCKVVWLGQLGQVRGLRSDIQKLQKQVDDAMVARANADMVCVRARWRVAKCVQVCAHAYRSWCLRSLSTHHVLVRWRS